MRILILFSTLFFLFTSCNAQTNESIKVENTTKYAQLIAMDSVTLIDVRTPNEYASGHLVGAVNINYLGNDFLASIQQYDKEKPIYIYCQSGNRSGKAAKLLAENGFKNIIDLAGGFRAWSAQQLPTE